MPTKSPSVLTDQDIALFRSGDHCAIYEKMGAHLCREKGKSYTRFSVWTPNAQRVSVVGDFNAWDGRSNPLRLREDGSGIWEGVSFDAKEGSTYKFHIESKHRGYVADKGDPFAFQWERAPQTASIITDLSYAWGDADWMKNRHRCNALDAPQSVYEMHLGGWRRIPEEGNRFLGYREMAQPLAAYLKEMGFTHVEFLPIMEHPFYGSWGYQITGYYAPSSRYGSPQDLMYLIDTLHQNGIGVLLDWVPSHFPCDEHGLAFFDGTHLYEHADPKKGFHPDWKSAIFNYGRLEVQSFLISNALFWLDRYHVDGLRVDAVASMLYLDYSRKAGEWIPNWQGGRENLEAVDFLKKLNWAVYRDFPDVQTTAEESTAWPMVSRPTDLGGLGFGMKWNMGWMHDTLAYFAQDPLFRKYHHNELTFSLCYAFTENFVLPLSHDEVVHGKGSLLGKMPGDDWQRFAQLRLLFGYLYGHPGKKLLFMGGELAQIAEWDHNNSLEWHLLDQPSHRGVQQWVRDLNRFYRTEKACHEQDFEPKGFEWIDSNDDKQSLLAFLRHPKGGGGALFFIFNFTPVPRKHYQIGVPAPGYWREILNSDAEAYGGSGLGNLGGVESQARPSHGRDHSITLTVPPFAALILKKAE